MTVLVIGGTGTVGGEVVRTLAARGVDVRVMTRTQERASELPAGARGVVGDLAEPRSLNSAFAGVEGVFLLTPLGARETEFGLAAVKAARESGARRLVYMSVRKPPESLHIPFFRSKVPVENAIRSSGLEWTLLQPNSFFQNDRFLREAVVGHGVYPLPIGGRGIARVDVRDIADAAANALTGSGHAGQVYTLNGPEAQTGEDVAQAFGRQLGREVRYAGDDLDAWAEGVAGFMPARTVQEFRVMFQYYQDHGAVATDEEYLHQEKVVGHAPRPFDAFASELVREWGAVPEPATA